MSEIKKTIKIWASWNSDKFEDYLEEMEAQGWNLITIKKLGYRVHFIKGMPRKIRYCVDFQNKKSPEYESLCREAGWKCELSSSGWYVWSMPYTDERPAIYTDIDSLIDRNKRLMSIMIVLMSAQTPVFMMNIASDPFRLTLTIFYVLLYGLFFYGIYQLNKTNRKLREKNQL
ncbi:DUF2812 domain-containing protein [Paenibacillus sp. HWE-109]|uniref:DUF2812 domain-containing protein n=1 Tax=Paenibacillus sp. HWE-109 TaxID=1306526 RepID=UPI001EDCF9EE|nr:DUF2812 domain-containing protein [Paenibacillus sp. HWE-109]UKS28753.1 DUF2812 domain-containing protein [Paenibacillus sp. HWE-109]